MTSRSTRCRECGYGPIGPFADNCPICAASVRGEDGDGRASAGSGTTFWERVPIPSAAGAIAIIVLSAWLCRGDLGWVLLTAGPAALAWWFLVLPTTPTLLRTLAGTYVGLLAIGIGVASQPEILPGLANRPRSFEEIMQDALHVLQGGNPHIVALSPRLKTWVKCQLIAFPLAVAPPFFFLPPLIGRRHASIVPLNRPSCFFGLVCWAGLIGIYAVTMLPEQVEEWQKPVQPQINFPGMFPHPAGKMPAKNDDGDDR
jgi:hypothetical protein